MPCMVVSPPDYKVWGKTTLAYYINYCEEINTMDLMYSS